MNTGVGRRCLVLHPGALGDVLLAVPALRRLGASGLPVVLAAASGVRALLEDAGVILAGRDLETLSLHRLFAGVGPAAAEPFRGAAAIVSWLGAGDPVYRAGLAAVGRALGADVVIARSAPPPGSGRHVADHLAGTVAGLVSAPAIPPDDGFLTPAPSEMDAAGRWLGERGLGPGQAVVLHPGAGARAKEWPGFAALAGRLRAAGQPVVVTTGPADGEAVERLTASGAIAPGRVAAGLPPRGLAALLALARGYVGNDSGPTHLAALVGTPVVAVFGPTDPAAWAPRGSHVRVVAGAARAGPDPWEGLDAGTVERALADAMATGPRVAATREREAVA